MEVQLYAFVNSAQGSGSPCIDSMRMGGMLKESEKKSLRLPGIELRFTVVLEKDGKDQSDRSREKWK
jgi:hypothetical protein